MRASPIRFAWSGEFAIGYQTVGDGPVDVVYIPGWATNLDWTGDGITTRSSFGGWRRSRA